MIRGATRLSSLLLLALAAQILLISCSSRDASIELGWTPNAPAVYRVSVESESRFGGPVSDLSAKTLVSAALRATPISEEEAEIEVLYLAASVTDASGETVGLSLPDVSGETVTVRFSPPGVVSQVEGGDGFLGAQIPLISMEDLVVSIFPPLPEGSFQADDTWTGETPPPFPNLGPQPITMRYVVDSVGEESDITGYELSVSPRDFSYETAGDEVSGEGNLNVNFQGTLDAQGGYQQSSRTATFESDFLRQEDGGYANGNLRLTQELQVEKLGAFEQFGLDINGPE